MNPNNPSQDTLNGGRMVPVTCLDGSTAEIKVRQVRIREIDTYLGLEDDEVARICLVADLEPEQLDGLTIESYEALVEADAEVNAPFVAGRRQRREQALARRIAELKRTLPEHYERMVEQMGAAATSAIPTAASSSSSPSAAE